MVTTSDLDEVLRRAVEAGDVPGVVALAATDHGILYQGAFGRRDIAGIPPMSLDTIFRIASMTKAVTSVAAMQLVEKGKLTLDEPIGRVLPELATPYVLQGFDPSGKPRLRPAKRPITLRHLLTHTAGFGYEMLNSELIRYVAVTHTPSPAPANSLRCDCLCCSIPARDGNMASTSIGSAAPSKLPAASRSTSIFATKSSTRSA